jgi:sortase A
MLRGALRVIGAIVSVASICAAVALGMHIWLFLHNSSTRGAALVHTERQAIAAAAGDGSGCQAKQPDGPRGLLEAPSLGLVAPVLDGTGDDVLAVAVGHVPASVWPGQPGTSVLSAHDVTWFSGLTRLRTGDQLRYVTPCTTYSFQVTSHAVVNAGSPVYNTAAGRLVLDTCYPLDALYFTPTRYLVYAVLTGSAATQPAVAAPANWPVPDVPVPAELANQGLSLNQNYAPLGTLSITGDAEPAWQQSSAPMQLEAAGLTEYFGLLRSAAQDQAGWWRDLAPQAPMPTALTGATITGYSTRLRITLDVTGSRPQGVTLTAVVTLSNGATRTLTVGETVTGGKLLATRIAT